VWIPKPLIFPWSSSKVHPSLIFLYRVTICGIKKKTQLIYKFRWYVKGSINWSNCKAAEVSQTRCTNLFSQKIFRGRFAYSSASTTTTLCPWQPLISRQMLFFFLVMLHWHILEEVLASTTERCVLAECYIQSVCSVCPDSKLRSPILLLSSLWITVPYRLTSQWTVCFVSLGLNSAGAEWWKGRAWLWCIFHMNSAMGSTRWS